MKKIFLLLLISVCTTGLVNAQGKFAASLTNTNNVITFQLKPDVTTTTGFSTIEFFLRYPDPSPAFNYGTVTVNTTAFPGMAGNGNVGGGAVGSGAWEIERDNPAYILPGYHVDHFIFTAPAATTTPASYTAGTAYDVLSVPLIGATNTVDFQFVSDDFEATYYLAITDETGVIDLRPATPANYFFPATLSTPGPGGSTIYYQELIDVPVPVKFLGFDVVKKDKDAILSWSVENEDANTNKYIIERSVNGTDFKPAFEIPALKNGKSSNTYSATQKDIASIRSSGVLYFRIKQVDHDGKFVYTDIKTVRLDGKAFAVSAYPNPLKTSTTLTIDLVKDSKILVSVSDANGKQIKSLQFQGFKGANIKPLNMSELAAGNYLVKVNAGDEIKTFSIVKVN